MKRITDLLPADQDKLMESLSNLPVYVDPKTGREYVYFLGEQIDYVSASNTQFLKG